MTRGGTILIIVAGICALLASLTLAFIVRTRASTEETLLYEAEVQARIMLVAGCTYVCEAARIGYDTATGVGTDNEHQEAFGWIDVRDGSEGPNTRISGDTATSVKSLFSPALAERRKRGGALVRPAWPAKGSVARCPMYVMERPPYAVELTAVYNPIVTDSTSPLFGVPYLRKPDPQPVDRAKFMEKDERPRLESVARSWFRIYREPRLPGAAPSDGPATFIITVGGGATAGWRDYDEVLAADEDLVSHRQPPRFAAEFNNEASFFETLRAQEIRMWFRIEWSPTVASSMDHNIVNSWHYTFEPGDRPALPKHPTPHTYEDIFVSFPMNVSDSFRTQAHARNMCGTIRWVQRLRKEPSEW
jgi:hypothetical protein